MGVYTEDTVGGKRDNLILLPWVWNIRRLGDWEIKDWNIVKFKDWKIGRF